LSLATSRDLVNRLIAGGSQAAIVSNAKRLETIVPMTTDREKLLAGLERLRDLPQQWEAYSELEKKRADEILSVMGPMPSFVRTGEHADSPASDSETSLAPNAGVAMASTPNVRCLLARVYAREEWQFVRKSAERIGITVGRLAEFPAPKALVYFGDSLRQKAGQHFLRLAECHSNDVASGDLTPSAGVEIDAAINEATARGVHFFTIQAEGILGYSPGWDTERHRAAQDTLVSLAAETGGEAFLGGASNKFIADRIETLTSCRLLLSFPPGDLPRDKSMNVTLELHVPKVKIQTQGRIVVPSQESIERSRLVAAFADPASSDDGSLRALLIPRGGNGQTWKATLQLRLRPTGFPDNSAELGASIVRNDKVIDHFASSIATKSGSREMVLEKSIDIAPGAFEIVAVARDAKRGDVGSSRIEAIWPSLTKGAAAIAPIAVLQNAPAAMSKDGAVTTSGSLARDADELLDPSTGVTLASVVCRGARTKASITVERWLDGEPSDELTPITIAETDGPCVPTVDVVRAGRLQSGVADYRIVARIGDEIVAQERRTLRVGVKP
jgi:hypothetical protein